MIIFDIAAFEAEYGLERRSSSSVPHSADQLSRSLSRAYGLMSWPEHFYNPRTTEGDQRKSNSLSAKAMQLSIFGSMVCSVFFN